MILIMIINAVFLALALMALLRSRKKKSDAMGKKESTKHVL
ncbi:hypothetical protein GBAR_LOCUS3129 [Geodia barretti]|uniref:Uncharacterized protein n=1 Tax=Geodia barretti TaxID=519541 RepID=A0AA35R206_GEOBA|nr:hypothetical protein GBAR_LOCUS3129 [Geodia barretti]